MTAPHDRPTIDEIVEAVREWLERDVIPATEGRLQFHSRVASNMLAMVERELALGSSQRDAHDVRLASLGFRTETQLATAIREGTLDERYTEVKAAVWATVKDKLLVANPKYLEQG
jgi:hypothetical protein